MTASFKPQAIAPQPERLQRVDLGQRVRVVNSDRIGKVVHPYRDEMGRRMAWVKFDSGARGLFEVSSLVAVK